MATLQYPVTPNGPAAILTQIRKGTSISNTDEVNAVWISESSSVAPGNGQKLNPQASTSVLQEGPMYACVDTGVTSPVTLTVSDTLDVVSDPVSIAEAIAAVGVPQTYINTPLLLAPNQPLGIQQLPNGSVLVNPNKSGFFNSPGNASVYVQLVCCDSSGNPIGGDFRVDIYDTTAGSTIRALNYFSLTGSNISSQWCLPIVGGRIVITNNSASQYVLATFTGSSKVASKPLNVSGMNSFPRQVSTTSTFNLGYLYPISTIADGTTSYHTSLNGECTLNIQCGSATLSGTIFAAVAGRFDSVSPLNLPIYTGVLDNQTLNFAHPLVPVIWYFQPDSTKAVETSTIELTIIPKVDA